MRDIKFRSWDKHREEYLSAGKVFIPIYPSSTPKTCKELNLDTSNFLCATGRMVLEQFTGMKDKFGKDIFEGDIVSSDYYLPDQKSVATIKFEQEDNWCRFGFDSGEQDAFRFGNLTVIGNIHQNPELLSI